jgi:hypothetical protein
MRLADFICAGAQKSGTTWLHAQISRHPQVFMRTKELNFFYRDLPLSWYAEQFHGAARDQRCGDISPNYAAFVGLAERIYGVCPNALIIHLLRDPVERAFSQWKMARHLGNVPLEVPFIQAFRDNLQYMRRRGEYSLILEEYVRFYPLGEQIAVFWYDDIRIRPAELMRKIMIFLNLDSEWKSANLHSVVGPSQDQSVISARDAVEVAAYYAPFDRRLCALLGVATLPWSTDPPHSSVNRSA